MNMRSLALRSEAINGTATAWPSYRNDSTHIHAALAIRPLLQTLSRRCVVWVARPLAADWLPSLRVYQIASYLLGLHASRRNAIRQHSPSIRQHASTCSLPRHKFHAVLARSSPSFSLQTLDTEHPLASAVDALRGPYLVVALFSSIIVCSSSVRRHVGCGRDRNPSWPSAVCRWRHKSQFSGNNSRRQQSSPVQSSPPFCFVAPAAPEHQSRGAEPGQARVASEAAMAWHG